MKSVVDIFCEHPHEQGETYFVHLKHASQCSVMLSVAAGACLIHAFLPFMFKDLATSIAKGVLNKRCKHQK